MLKVLKGFPPYFNQKINYNKPIFFGIHLNPVCNFRCKKCFIGEQKSLRSSNEMLSLSEIFKIMESAKKSGAKVFGITGAGEPFLDKRIYKVIRKANQLGFITHIPTNISTLSESLLKFLKQNNVTLVLSLDTLDKRKFIQLTHTNEQIYGQVLKNLQLAQKIYQGTKKIEIINGQKIEVYRIAIHMTIHRENLAEVNKIRRLVLPDTLFSVSPLAYAGLATCNFELEATKEAPRQMTERHIVIYKDQETKRNLCGFFRFGVDINFDGQLLLDAHAIDTREVFKNIRDFRYDVQASFDYLKPIKLEFIEHYLQGFCPIRTPRLKEWIEKRRENHLEEKAFINQIIKDIKLGNPLLKYAYIAEGAERFLTVLKSPEYHTYKTEINIVNKHSNTLRGVLTGHVVVLGVGDGAKLKNLLQPIKARNCTLVDISHHLLNIADKNIGRNFKILNISFEKLDFKIFPQDSTFIMLGGTLGNMLAWTKFIKKLKKNIPRGRLIVGLEFVDASNPKVVKRTIREYDNESGFRFIFYPLSILGFNRNDGHIEVSFNYNQNRIEEYFVLNNFGAQKAKHLGFSEFQKILLSASLKLGEVDFVQKMGRLGAREIVDYKKEQNHIIGFML